MTLQISPDDGHCFSTLDSSALHKFSHTNSAQSPKSEPLFMQHNQPLSVICSIWFFCEMKNHPFQRWQRCSCKNYPTALLPLSSSTKKIVNFSPKLVIKPVISSGEAQALNIRKNLLHNALSKEGAHNMSWVHPEWKKEENFSLPSASVGSVLCRAKPQRIWNNMHNLSVYLYGL